VAFFLLGPDFDFDAARFVAALEGSASDSSYAAGSFRSVRRHFSS